MSVTLVIKTIVSLIIVLALALIVLKLASGYIQTQKRTREIEIIDVALLGRGQKLVLVKVESKKFLLSISLNNIYLIDSWEIES